MVAQTGIEEENLNTGKLSIVAIGASAGGLEAMVELLSNLPADTGMAYVYIQHLDPHLKSDLTDIFSRATAMPVTEALHQVTIEVNHLYIIPPNKEMSLADGRIILEDRPRNANLHLPINKFFTSLAERYRETSIGIILSGTATDGTLGLKSIKLAGGLTFAQDNTAKFQSMPSSAVTDGSVDLVLSPKEIAEELCQISRHKENYYTLLANIEDQTIDKDEELKNILTYLNKTVGVDFRHYKMSTIRRRIARRMVLHKLETLVEYRQYLKQNPKEINLLYQDLLINVTTFFRDEEVTSYLRKTLLPNLIKTKQADDPIRIWVPACSTGQEVYSIAMLLVETLRARATTTPIQIFATDLNEAALNKARMGIYAQAEVGNVSAERLQTFFIKIDGHYRITKELRNICIFASHNIAKDPPFSKLDIVSCCNLLIYLDVKLQRKIFNTFHYALNPNGYLILGKSESVTASTNLFSLIEKNLKVYIKNKDDGDSTSFETNYHNSRSEARPLTINKPTIQAKKNSEQDLEKIVDRLLLSRFSPASVVVNYNLDIIHFKGPIGMFLEPSPGAASLNLLKMAKQGLSFELRNVVHKAKQSGEAVKKENLQITFNNKKLLISIEAIPFKAPTLSDEYYVVVFKETIVAQSVDGTEHVDARVKQLEGELVGMREDMRLIIEEKDLANEELQSANEEIVSNNEELQSINEELESSKEEIESSNEELIMINQELQERNTLLFEEQEYSQSVFAIMRESLLILDSNLCIKKANRIFYKTFHVTEEETLGKKLYEVGNKQWNILRLRYLLEEVIPQNTDVENFEVEYTFPRIGKKDMILNASKISQSSGKNLILLAIEDVTEFRKGKKDVEEKEHWFRAIADDSPAMLWVVNPDKSSKYFNKTWLEFCGKTIEEALQSDWICCVHPDDREACQSIWNLSFAAKKPFEIKHRLRRFNNEYPMLFTKAKPHFTAEGEFAGFIGTSVELQNL